VDPQALVVTGGATSGLLLVGTFLLQPGAVVFVEDPTYFIALDILSKDLGLRIVPVAMTETGVDTAALEQAVQAAKPAAAGDDGTVAAVDRYWGMFYTIPTFHNPTGISASLATCRQVVEIAARHGLLVLCDDVYNLLRYNNINEDDTVPPPGRLKALDPHGLVISNGTFSKILSPGIRLGWLELPLALVPRLTNSGVLLSGGCINNYMSGLINSLIQLDLMDAHLAVLVQLYRDRMEVAQRHLAAHLPPGWRVARPGGGYFLWVQEGVAEAEILLLYFQICSGSN
jgi:DNA-binding transcriptional MocR family regulator